VSHIFANGLFRIEKGTLTAGAVGESIHGKRLTHPFGHFEISTLIAISI
jgi:hypothetical protein